MGQNPPNYDTYGLLRALHFHNPTPYSHIVGLSSHFHVHAEGQCLSSTYEQVHVGFFAVSYTHLDVYKRQQCYSNPILFLYPLQKHINIKHYNDMIFEKSIPFVSIVISSSLFHKIHLTIFL